MKDIFYFYYKENKKMAWHYNYVSFLKKELCFHSAVKTQVGVWESEQRCSLHSVPSSFTFIANQIYETGILWRALVKRSNVILTYSLDEIL